MRWILWILGVLIGFAALVAAFGAVLPVAHVATRRARFKQAPAALFEAITSAQDWRPQVKKYEVLSEQEGKRRWKETDKRGDVITYEVVERQPPTRYVTRIADPKLPFGGRWIFAIQPFAGGSEVTITEEGEIYNVFFRALAKLVFGYTSTIDDYLKALGAKFGEQVSPEG